VERRPLGRIGQIMKWISALSRKNRWEEALAHCASQIREHSKDRPDLILLFLTPHFASQYEQVAGDVYRQLTPKHLLGCSAGGVIAGGMEAENQPAVGMMAGILPGVKIASFHLQADQLPDEDAPPKAWAEAVSVPDRSLRPQFILLADPFSFNPEELARGIDYAFPGAVSVGGLASGAMKPLQNALYLDRQCRRSGATGLALTGNIVMDPIVAQGCRPIGKQFKITQCEQNLLLELDGHAPLKVLEDMIEELPDEDQELARHSLFLGILNNPLKSGSSKKDYLVRNLIGMDVERGILAIGAMLRPGQMVQFHLRDRQASAEDVTQALKHYAASAPQPPPAAALLFSCVGRGEHLYGVPNHDTNVFLRTVGRLPVGGFFCNGEIGPVEGATYLHGYTSCFGVLRPASKAS
jgi:small ligand-binding sensory domain FIST